MSIKRSGAALFIGALLLVGTTAIAPPAFARTRQQHILLSADGATGHFTSLSADFTARATTLNFVPIKGLIIKMQDAGGAHHTVCIAVTNALGEAYCQATASNDVLLILSGVVTGYNAVFEGNAKYFPATAHGRILPTVP